MEVSSPTILYLVIGFSLSFVPMLTVVATAFTKILVVILIIRNAIGIQQTPPNIVLFAFALILTGFVMAPTLASTVNIIGSADVQPNNATEYADMAQQAMQPLKAFLLEHASPVHIQKFQASADILWETGGESPVLTSDADNIFILMPSFLITELTRAFQIGLMLYLPFLAIDIIVSSVLMALGMMLVSPTLVSVPFKLFLFVIIDGWSLLVHGLVLSYA